MINTIFAPLGRLLRGVIAPENIGQVPEEIHRIDNPQALDNLILYDTIN
jgi:hypothetical protein